jgi:hypothetical protein
VLLACKRFHIKLCLEFERNTLLRFIMPYIELGLDRLLSNYASFRLLKTACSPNDNVRVSNFMNSSNTILYCPDNEATHFTVYFVTTLFKKLIIPLPGKYHLKSV